MPRIAPSGVKVRNPGSEIFWELPLGMLRFAKQGSLTEQQKRKHSGETAFNATRSDPKHPHSSIRSIRVKSVDLGDCAEKQSPNICVYIHVTEIR